MKNIRKNKLRIKYTINKQKESILIYNYDVIGSIKFSICVGLILLIASLLNDAFLGFFFPFEFIAILGICTSCRRTEIAFCHPNSQIAITIMGVSKKAISIPFNPASQRIELTVEAGEYRNSSKRQLKGVFLIMSLENQVQTINLVDPSAFLTTPECQSLAHEANTFIQTQLLKLSYKNNSD